MVIKSLNYCLGKIFSTIKWTFAHVNWTNRQVPHSIFTKGYPHIIVLIGGNSTFNFSLFKDSAAFTAKQTMP